MCALPAGDDRFAFGGRHSITLPEGDEQKHVLKLDVAVDESEQSVVGAAAHILAGMDVFFCKCFLLFLA